MSTIPAATASVLSSVPSSPSPLAMIAPPAVAAPGSGTSNLAPMNPMPTMAEKLAMMQPAQNPFLQKFNAAQQDASNQQSLNSSQNPAAASVAQMTPDQQAQMAAILQQLGGGAGLNLNATANPPGGAQISAPGLATAPVGVQQGSMLNVATPQ